jgi:mono/diheme cytochrome c family protein
MLTLRILLVLLIVISVVVLVLMLSGLYDVGADTPHWAWVERLAAATRNASIDARAKDVAAPDLSKPELIAEGAEHYSEMCVDCHRAPGVEESEIRKGLYPKPPDLHAAPRADPSRQFWVIKHGIKMSAMPAWGVTHDDPAIWGIVAFLQKLPTLSAAEYQRLTANAADVELHGAHADHSQRMHESLHPENSRTH